jgi:putative transposase
MGLPRSTFYDAPAAKADDAASGARIAAICDEFEAYGYRRVGAALRHQGVVVNGKKIRRLMREHDLQPRRHRRFVATTDSDHDGPIFPDRAKGMGVDGPNQLWVADITYIAIATGFVYLAAILDAWSRRVVGSAISRSIDARLTMLGSRWRRSRPPSAPGSRRRDACTTPTVARSTRPRSTASSLPTMASSARRAGAATPTTMRRRRAS